jgi:hypothetical protein
MPRLNLTDAEVTLIEKHRAKNLAANSYNEGLDRARALSRAAFKSLPLEGSVEVKDIYEILTAFEEVIQLERRPIV